MSMSIRKGEKGGKNNHPVSIKCICNNDPTIPNMDKIQLAFEAISILAQ